MSRVAVAVHGAGSTADFAHRVFPAAVIGVDRVIARQHDGRMEDILPAIDDDVRALMAARADVMLCGVSLGAHAIARYAAHTDAPLMGLMCVMPAWTGSGGDVAAFTRQSGMGVRESSIAAVLSEMDATDWVTRALSDAWRTYDDRALAAALTAAAASAGPTEQELAAIACPVGIAVLADDPLHPAEVGDRWAALMPVATVRTVARDEPQHDVAVLGAAAAAAWESVSGSR